MSPTGPHQGILGHMREHLHLPCPLPLDRTSGILEFSFSCAGNLKKGGGWGVVLKRKNPVPSQTCTIIPTCLWRWHWHSWGSRLVWLILESVCWGNIWPRGLGQEHRPRFHIISAQLRSRQAKACPLRACRQWVPKPCF